MMWKICELYNLIWCIYRHNWLAIVKRYFFKKVAKINNLVGGNQDIHGHVRKLKL